LKPFLPVSLHAGTPAEIETRLQFPFLRISKRSIPMDNENKRILGRILAIEETSAVAGARPTSTLADTRIDVNGNPDTSPTQDSGTVQDTGTTQDSGTTADSTTIIDINIDPSTAGI
jgi:hypothetical protein